MTIERKLFNILDDTLVETRRSLREEVELIKVWQTRGYWFADLLFIQLHLPECRKHEFGWTLDFVLRRMLSHRENMLGEMCREEPLNLGLHVRIQRSMLPDRPRCSRGTYPL